ncbi:MAG TPA: bifunctional demethylmenaquinone methyltransferase/2-methoxy-6-polyprenyl-1,4-benzoquinol methylase UbiE [Alphaproteobacteria bacterium]
MAARRINPALNAEADWFGDRRVQPEEKTELVLDVFHSVARKYDLMNDLMSAGYHRLWKDRLIRMIQPRPNWRYLDVAGGTGDIAFRLHDATDGHAPITVCDINASMLKVGESRAIDRGILHNLDWVEGNAEKLPFPDNYFDVYTIAFGLRNVTRIDNALREACRVLKPGGRFFCLEFSHVDNPALKTAYRVYSDKVIPKIGKMVANDASSYQYLIESIRKFPRRNVLCQRLKLAGFRGARVEKLSFGLVAVHEARK